MTFSPRRFWLPAIAVPFSGLLMCLERTFHTQNILTLTNDVLNFPASTAYYDLTIRMGRGNHVYPFPGWPDRGLYLALVAICWYLVGVELDFHLLQRIAAKGRFFRVSWTIIAVSLQLLIIGLACLFTMEAFQQKPGERFDAMAIAFAVVFLLWFQLTAVRFWKARQTSNIPQLQSRQETTTDHR